MRSLSPFRITLMRIKHADQAGTTDAPSIDDAFSHGESLPEDIVSPSAPLATVQGARQGMSRSLRSIFGKSKGGKRKKQRDLFSQIEGLESLVMMDASGAFGEALYGHPAVAPKDADMSAGGMIEEELSMMAEEVYRASMEEEAMPSDEAMTDALSSDTYGYETEMADASTHEKAADSGVDMSYSDDAMEAYATEKSSDTSLHTGMDDMRADDNVIEADRPSAPPATIAYVPSSKKTAGTGTEKIYGPAPDDERLIPMYNDAIEVPRGIDAARWGPLASHTPPEALASMAPGFTVQDMALSPDGQTMVMSTRDGAVHLFGTETGSQFNTLLGHEGIVTKVVFSPNGEHIASTAYDRTVRIWDIRSGRTVSRFDLPNLGVELQYSPDGTHIAVGMHEQSTRVIELATGNVQQVEMPGRILVTRFRFTPDGTQLAHAFGKHVVLYDLASASITRTYKGLSDVVYALDIDPSGTYLAAGDDAGKTAVWRIDSARRIILQQKHTGRPAAANGLRAVQFDPYRRLITADYDGTVIVQDVSGLRDNEEPVEIARHRGPRGPGSLVTRLGERFVMNTTHDLATSRVIVYDLPDLPPGSPWVPQTPHGNGTAGLHEKIGSILGQNHDIETPMDPDISVVKISGLNILAAFKSPVRKSIVTIGPRGVLSRQYLTHVGGTEFDMTFVTFDKTHNTGVYMLTLWDGESNEILDTLPISWNERTGILTLVNGEADMLQNTDEIDTGTFDTVMGINSAYLGDEQINRIQRARLYELTAEIDSAYDLTISGNDIEQLIYQYYPIYHPDNWHAEIMRMWREEYPGFESGRVEDFFHNSRLGIHRTLREGLERYEQAVSEMLQIAVDGLVQIRKGMNPEEMNRNLNEAFDRWVNPILQMYKTQAGELAQLQSLNIFLPSRERIIEAAIRVLCIAWQEMIRREQDVLDYRQYVTMQVDSDMYLNARNQWVAISKEKPSSLPPELDRRQVALAAKILRTLKTSNDPRILALNAAGRNTISLHAANNADDDMSADVQLNQVLLALADADSPESIGGVRVDMPGVWESARNHVAQMDEASVFHEMSNLYASDDQSPLTIDGITVKATTVAARMVLGFYHHAADMREDQDALARLCVKMEQVTGIDATHLYGLARFYNQETFARRLVERFEASSYFIRDGSEGAVTVDRGLRPIVEYRDTVIRVHIDVPSFGANLQHFQVNLVNIHNRINIIQDVAPYTSNRLYVDIPASVMRDRNMEVGIKAVAWLEGRDQPIWGITTGIDATRLEVGEEPEDVRSFVGDAWDNLTDEQQTRLHSALDFGDLSLLPKNKEVIDWLVANYLDPSSNKMRFDPNKMEWIGSRYDNTFYDENGNLVQSKFIGECKWWVDVIIEKEVEFKDDSSYIIPPLKPNLDEDGTNFGSYEWEIGTGVTQEHQNLESGNLDEDIQSGQILAGDFIQYATSEFQHTVIVGAITPEGVWVFDSNYLKDDTPRYHLLSNSHLHSARKFTVYRLKQ